MAETPESEKLSFSTKLAYGAGDLGPAITANILVFYLMFFFTNVVGLNVGLASVILLIGKIWDAVNDPLVGVLSDRTQSKWGRRHPWMFWGAIPFGGFFFLQWMIPTFSANPETNQWGLFWYYVLISIVSQTFYTIVNLPYTALTPELTQDYNERTSLNSFRFAFSIGGSIFSLLLALVIFGNVKADSATQYLVLAGVCTVFSVLPLYWCIWGTKDRVAITEARRQAREAATAEITGAEVPIPIKEQLKIVLSNKPFLYVIGIYLCSWLGVQVTASIIPYFVVNWMGQREADSPLVALAVQGTALGMLFFWSNISKRVGKKAVYYMGTGLWILAQTGLFFLQPGQLGWMYFLAIIAGFGVSVAYLIPWSMIPDVIELDELQTGNGGREFSDGFMVLLAKVGLALGLFLVGQALHV
ncbi:MAG: MFS transporter, partial [Coleofasciculaceae cyanobacterium SM2_1_6]|nr:MFS transporter [Coleofasciculaceae cyanobacterium SM2_1_6]